jgi:hypothetical protein
VVVAVVLMVAHWDTVRGDLEAWHFQLTRQTETIRPDPDSRGLRVNLKWEVGKWYILGIDTPLRVVADHFGYPVVFDPVDAADAVLWRPTGDVSPGRKP